MSGRAARTCKDGNVPVSTSRSRSTGRTGNMLASDTRLSSTHHSITFFYETHETPASGMPTPTHTSVHPSAPFARKFYRARSHTLRSRCPALGARALSARHGQRICALSPVRMMTAKVHWTRRKLATYRWEPVPHLTHHGLFFSDGIEVCSSRATASGLRLILDLISRLFSLPPTFTTSPDLNPENGRTDGPAILSPTAG